MGLSVFFVRVKVELGFNWLSLPPHYFRVGASSYPAACQRAIRAAIKLQRGQHVEFLDVRVSRYLRRLKDPDTDSYVGISSIDEIPSIGKFQPAKKSRIARKQSGCIGKRGPR